MKEECIICKAPLEYLEIGEVMECSICRKKEASKTRCIKGHYVCNECHTAGMDVIIGLCMKERSKNPVEIIEKMMGQPFCHMHGPEHHVMVGAALLTAYKNAGGDINLPQALAEIMSRGKSVPGGACGFWGACGAGISRDVCVDRFQIHSIGRGSIRTFSFDDFKGSGRNRDGWRSTLLQKRFLLINPCCHRICEGAFGN